MVKLSDIRLLSIICFSLFMSACTPSGDTNNQVEEEPSSSISYVDRQEDSGMSMAITIDDVPLAHTGQMLPIDRNGDLVGRSDLEQQYGRVMDNLRQALKAGNSSMNQTVQLRFYVKHEVDTDTVRQLLAKTFSGSHKPTVSYVVSHLPHPEALVAADAVALSSNDSRAVSVHRGSDLPGTADQGDVAIMPRGNKVYLSGQTEPGQMIESTVNVMKSLLGTAAWVGLDASDIVQVKAFMHPIADAEAVEDTVRSFFREGLAPPFVAVEWHDASYLSYLSLEEEDGPVPIEIEILLSRGETEAEDSEAVTYSTPPWMGQPEYYSRIAEMHSGRMLFVSGLYAEAENPRAELEAMYQQMGSILDRTGSGFEHLLKGTYYVTNEASSVALNQIRPEYYPSYEAPTSSKMPVRATGRSNSTVTFDMIGVIPD
jgi:enamine deaminase RidA (YjgF/YER057c/UK114 family)